MLQRTQDVRCQAAGEDLGHRRHDLVEVEERGRARWRCG